MMSSYQFDDNYLNPGTYKKSPNTNNEDVIKEYTVRSGDTIGAIANRFSLKQSTLQGINNLGQGEIIKPNQVLKIPRMDGLLYKVEAGDTFASLQKKYQVSEKIIKRINNKADNYILKTEDDLLLANVDYVIREYNRSSNVYIPGRDIYIPAQKTFNRSTGGGRLAWPVRGIITQGFFSAHRAIDIANKIGTTIFAAEAGTVSLVSVGSYGHGYGNYAIINHGNGLQTLYAHMSKVYIKEGQKVGRGESIGAMGSTGRSTGPHLHFEVRDGKIKGNPYSYLK